MNLPWMYNWKMVAATLLVQVLIAMGWLSPLGRPGTPLLTPKPPATSTGAPAATPSPAPASSAPVSPAPTSTAPSTTPAPGKVSGEVIVRLDSTDESTRQRVLGEAAAAAGVGAPTIVRELATGALLVRVTGDEDAYLAALDKQAGVSSASANSRITRAATANDPYFQSYQWNLRSSGGGASVDTAWDRSLGAGARVAVLDTGKTNHPDLAGAWLGGYDFVTTGPATVNQVTTGDGNERDADATDPGDYCGADGSSWHGTHVAGIIAARRNNAAGIAGVAPRSQVVPVRVLGRCGGNLADLIDAIVWAAGGRVPNTPTNPHPARVLNMSLSSNERCMLDLQIAVGMARRLGALPVVAAGNYHGQAADYLPGNCAGVVTVAASTFDRGIAGYSNSGGPVALAAPGGDDTAAILSSSVDAGTTNTGAYFYTFQTGTSMASPHVAGAAALLLALKPNLTVDQLQRLLVTSAVPSDTCAGCGAGILDAAAAVARVPVLTSSSVSGREVTLTGSGFTRVTDVRIADQSLPWTLVNDTTIVATIPRTVPSGRQALWVAIDDIRSASVVETLA